jgi:hypothetical protein
MAKVTINGKSYIGDNIRVENNEVFIDGKMVDHGEQNKILEVKVEGGLANLEADGSVVCNDVHGTVQAGGSVTCDKVTGTVQAGGSVTCDDVGGNVMAGGSVSYG